MKFIELQPPNKFLLFVRPIVRNSKILWKFSNRINKYVCMYIKFYALQNKNKILNILFFVRIFCKTFVNNDNVKEKIHFVNSIVRKQLVNIKRFWMIFPILSENIGIRTFFKNYLGTFLTLPNPFNDEKLCKIFLVIVCHPLLCIIINLKSKITCKTLF